MDTKSYQFLNIYLLVKDLLANESFCNALKNDIGVNEAFENAICKANT